ncbi:DUF1579 family protein [Roseimaritima ulvae]|uniref:DUF1579 domain-containing protein n=1 Tax=Roseimaritima ulvae TaxID=980254 RepID=A0A5B9R226_9BACT|nr:DUF1579 family protein [Roseimaritima ulvae]QEG40281.1 hypothetical protein UC8_22880 [Roseimaritima ulvae]
MDPAQSPESKAAQQKFSSMLGAWTGVCRTWFQPGVLADESPIEGRFFRNLPGEFLRHQYTSSLNGKPRSGEETLIFNSITKRFECVWMDTFHMNYAIMFSDGEATEDGWFVVGSYDVAADTPRWGWKTVYQIVEEQRLQITAYNVSPEGQSDKAIELVYTRRRAS